MLATSVFRVHSLSNDASFHTSKGTWAFCMLGRGSQASYLQPHLKSWQITWRTGSEIRGTSEISTSGRSATREAPSCSCFIK